LGEVEGGGEVFRLLLARELEVGIEQGREGVPGTKPIRSLSAMVLEVENVRENKEERGRERGRRVRSIMSDGAGVFGDADVGRSRTSLQRGGYIDRE
jgi:hypothetical protein